MYYNKNMNYNNKIQKKREKEKYLVFLMIKIFCSVCPSHCYKKDMREKIREIMIFSSKRIIFYHPILTLKHAFIILKAKLKI